MRSEYVKIKTLLERSDAKILLVIAFSIASAYFLLFREYGLYSDDYTFISRPFAWQLPDLFNWIKAMFVVWPIGRPIGFILPQTFAFIGSHLGGLSTVYIFAFLIVTLNAFLFYKILHKIGPEFLAVTGALAMALYPGDTTRPFAMHATGLQTSMTFLLIATLLYISRWRPISYFVAALCLLTYESPFMVFFAVPLLQPKLDRQFARQMIIHIGICALLLFAAFAYRDIVGEPRVSSISAPLETARHALLGAIIGPATVISTFGVRVATVLQRMDRTIFLLIAVAFVVFCWLLLQIKSDPSRLRSYPAEFRSPFGSIRISPRLRLNLQRTQPHLLFATLVMLGLAYGLSFTHYPPTALQGQATSVHLAATFGASLLFGWICSAVWNEMRNRRSQLLVAGIIALYFASLVGFGLLVQRDYRDAWRYEQTFWRDVVRLVPDVGEGTVVLVVRDQLPDVRYIQAQSWAIPIILPEIFDFPKGWKEPPRVYLVPSNWSPLAKIEDGSFKYFDSGWSNDWFSLPSSNVVVVQMQKGKLTRETGAVMIQGHPLVLKSPDLSSGVMFKKGVLYNFLIDH